MANSAPSSLDKIYAPRDLFRGRTRRAWVWSILAVLLLLPFIMVCGLFAGLMIERGRLSVELPRADVPRFTKLTGLPAGVGVPRLARGDNAADTEPAVGPEKFVHVSFDEMGILPAVWHARDRWWGRGLAGLFRRFEWLQSNVLATISLLAIGALLATVRAWCLSHHRRECQRAALEAVSAPRRNLHRQVLRLGPEDLDGSGLSLAGRLFTTELEDVRRGLARWIEHDTRYPLELACLLAVVLSIQPSLAAQTLLLGGAMWYILDIEFRQAEQRRRLAADRAAGELRGMVDGFRTARLVRGLGIEQSQHDQFASQLLRHHDLAVQEDSATEAATHPRTLVIATSCGVAAFLLFLVALNVLPLQGELQLKGELTTATGGTFVVAWAMVFLAVKAYRRRMANRHETAVAAESIHRYLEQIPAVGQAVGAKFFQPLARTLHFDSVTYRLPHGGALLEGLDLKLEAGRTYALISVNPLEARALVSLLPRFIEPQSGRVLFDGEDIAWATLESLRAETVFVGANDPPLAGTVLENIRGGHGEYTLQQATDAAKTTHAHNFIVKLFNGYETVLTGRDDALDAGQRFRLALARAVLRNPAVLIVEEPLENLDEDTKALLADAYDRICVNRTVFFLPGRLSTVRRCNEVVVLHEGRVAAIGPQSRLVNLSAIYRHWEYLNFNEFRHQE